LVFLDAFFEPDEDAEHGGIKVFDIGEVEQEINGSMGFDDDKELAGDLVDGGFVEFGDFGVGEFGDGDVIGSSNF